ncbi:hypothetical protein J2R78_001350 [Bradyrhizobium sp. USDA 4538]|nr:hypothetical protein [Bradyrhizobium sp. USDA 4538]MCP1898947.1 hypothetical protein [Bradyrhizobium sp. USDA 4537]MCP1986939.1 hypothetical protein [Bradyrhizobium sp. USDA 4539]
MTQAGVPEEEASQYAEGASRRNARLCTCRRTGSWPSRSCARSVVSRHQQAHGGMAAVWMEGL